MKQFLENKLFHDFDKDELTSLISCNNQYFRLMVDIATTNNQPAAWRAPWLLTTCMKNNDPRIKPHLEAVIKAIDHKRDGFQRELLKIIIRMEITEKQEGILFDKCTSIWESTKKSPSVRIKAFECMAKIAGNHPELKTELKLLAHPRYTQSLSPGILQSLKKMIARF